MNEFKEQFKADQGASTNSDEPENGTKTEQAPSRETLQAEAQAAFEHYLKERGAFPKPMRPEAFYGLAGTIVRIMVKHCEASSETLLLQLLVILGNVIGRCAYISAGGPWLFPNEFAVIVGSTARGRKGTALRMMDQLLELAASEWFNDCTDSELQSGEGAIQRIRDERRGVPPPDRRRKSSVPDEPLKEVVLDAGNPDKRLLIIEEEFSQTLKMSQRSGNVLTETLRKAWDSPRILRTSNKNSPLKASDPHISFIGHSTREELLSTIKQVDISNGVANRILWVASERREIMPNVPFLDWHKYPEILQELREALHQYPANTAQPIRFKRSDQAELFWDELYRRLYREKRTGFLDAVLVRDTSHILKLALIFAILDQDDEIQSAHLKAALAICDYCQASARWIFGESTGNKLANNIFWALIRKPNGMTRTDISDDVCYRKTPATKIDEALEILAKNGLVKLEFKVTEKNRRIELWHAVLPH